MNAYAGRRSTYPRRSWGATLGDPPMHPRCKSLELIVPPTYEGLEGAVRHWIATCVMSRTMVGNVPARRERTLVNGNASLIDIWRRILRHHVGERTTIVAAYDWGPNRVESIRFTTTAFPPPRPRPPAPPPRPDPPPFDKAGCYTFCDENKVCCGRRTRMGGLQCQSRWQVCRDNCDRGRRWHFPDTDCQTRPPQSAFLGKTDPAVSAPVFRLECVPGCAPAAANQCRAMVRRAVRDAIALANAAATKLEAATPDAETVRLFRAFFGHHPSRPASSDPSRSSGNLVAFRFRKCAEELGGGRVMTFRCAAACPAGRNASTNGNISAIVMTLCPRFFNRPAGQPLGNQFFRAGVVLHEMLHLLFTSFFHHQGHPSGDPERRRDNAHCYEAFALRLAGHAAEPGDVAACRNRPV
jgi:hypothetical protein